MRLFFILSLLFCLNCISALGQRHVTKEYTCVVLQDKRTFLGIGVKAGDPISLTMKGYFLKRFGLEATAGYAMSGNFSPYVLSTLAKEPNFVGFTYQNHEVEVAYAAQARLLMHFPIKGNLPGLDWFILAGYHYRHLDINYHYIFKPTPTSREAARTDYTIIDQGPELGIGFEYVLSGKPFAMFAEISAMRKDNGLNQKITPLGGIGIRFNIAAPELDKKPTGQKQMKNKSVKKSSLINTLTDIGKNDKGRKGLKTKAKKKTRRKVTVHKHKSRIVPRGNTSDF